MKRFKKALLLISSIGAIAVPMAAVISCGGGVSRYDTENDKTIEISHPFSATGVQKKALASILKKYNSLIDDGTLPESEGYYRAKLKTVSGGYGKAIKNLAKDFFTKNKKGLENMIIDYPDSAAVLQSYKMGLNLNNIFKPAEAKTFKERFDQDFFKQNDNIGGVDKGAIVSIPISVSSMATAVNTPLFHYVVSEINRVKPNAIDVINNPKIKRLYDQGAKSPGDIIEIGKLWGTFDLSRVPADEQVNLIVNDNVLNEWDTMIKFVSAAQKGFGKKVNNRDKFHLLGLDSPTNVIQMLSYAYADGDMSKFYVTQNSDGYVHYTFLEDKDSDSYKLFKKGIDLIRSGVQSGGLFVAGLGAYSSAFMIKHKEMFSMGSTAGASHWYVNSDGQYTVIGADGGDVSARKDQIVWKGTQVSNPDQLIEKEKKSRKNTVVAASATGKKYDYKLESGKSNADLTATGKKLYLVDSKNVAATKAFTDAITTAVKVASQIGTTKLVYSISDANVSKITKVMETKELTFEAAATKATKETTFGKYKNKIIEFANKATASSYDMVLKEGVTNANLATYKSNGFDAFVWISKDDIADFQKKNDDTKAKQIGFKYDPVDSDTAKNGKFYIVKSDVVIKKLSTDQSLQEYEVSGEIMPTKIHGGKKGAIYVQGPSIIPVHANPGEDKATAKFIEWFIGSNTYDWDSNHVKGTMTPIMYWMNAAHYIPPIKGAFNSGSAIEAAITKGYDNKYTKKYWMGTKLAFDAFKKAHNDDSISPMILPIDDFTSIARNDITDVAIKDIYLNAHNSGTVSKFENIYNDMRLKAKSSKVI